MSEGLSAVGLHRRFRRRTVVHDLSLHIQPGEVVGLLGPNGAGKTTTFRMLTGLLRPHRGRITLDGRDVTGWPLWRLARRGLGYLPQQPTVFRRLTVAHNIELGLRPRRLDALARRHERDALLTRFGLESLAGARGETLSGGERRRVEVVRALAAGPRILLVDEPFAGLDPRSAAGVADALRALSRVGVGVLLTDHDVRQTLEACDRVYILNAGVLLLEGAPERIVADERARALYLGERFVFARESEGPRCRLN
jgi:lipopolysaccharide export system ATP-binding protein